MSLDEYLATGPPHEPPVVEAVLGHLSALGGDLHVEPVSVGILLKRGRSFGELRPMVRWEALSLRLPSSVRDDRLTRRQPMAGDRVWTTVRLPTPDDVNDQVRDWLTMAYVDAE
jgi:hypothetical protein